jgi:TRAP-type mannitol/chloroaromatic compound transport system permease large subunit
MIPQLVTVRYRRPDGRRRRLYVPVLPVVLLLSPLLLLAVLGGVIACLATRVSPAGALRGAGQLLWALPGTRFEIEQGRTAVLVSVR